MALYVNSYKVEVYNMSKLRWEFVRRCNDKQSATQVVNDLRAKGFRAKWIIRGMHAV